MAPAPTSLAHWGAFAAGMQSGDIASVTPLEGDTDPSPLLGNLPGSIRHRSRIATPAVRRGWLRDGPGATTLRGADEFVSVSWDELTELLASELRRVVDTHGNKAIYGGSYGWASAGRFHHAQSQVHRFLKFLGGYTFSRHSYSLGATGVIMPRVVGTHDDLFKRSTEWDVIVEHTDLLVCFGGLALKNTGINHGGTTAHPARNAMHRFRDKGGHVVSFSPLRDDIDGDCEWYAPVPGTDVAIMLALAHVLATESLADRDFLGAYCTGYERFERYLLGVDDGVPKSPQWASAICGLPADRSSRSPGEWPHAARSSPSAGRCSARGTASRRRGWADPGGDARPDRPSRRRFRPRLRVDERAGIAAAALQAAVTAAGPQPGRDVHPRRRGQRHAAAPRRAVRLQRTAPDLSRHQAGLLGRRQPVPPPPEHSAAAARTGPRRHRGGPRAVLDGDGQARRHRRAVDDRIERDDYSGSRNDPMFLAMPALTEPYARIARRLHDIRGAGRTGWGSASSSPRAALPGSGWRTSTTSGAAGLDFAVPDLRRVLACGPTTVADGDRPDPARRLPRGS